MNEDQNILEKSPKIEHYEDEIELIEILRIIWKWKYFILAGTMVCSLIAAIISINMSKIYSFEITLRPGLLKVGEQGNNIYIDSPQNVEALIESGMFKNDILNFLNDTKMSNAPRNLDFKVTTAINSNAVNIKYETADINQGMVIQDRIRKLLSETYSKRIQYFKDEYDMKLDLIKSEIEYIKNKINTHKKNVKNIDKRVEELMSEIELIKTNTSNLNDERNKLLLKYPKENIIYFELLHGNTFNQNIQLSILFRNEIKNYQLKKEMELQKIDKLEREIKLKSYDMKRLQFDKDNIQNIQVLNPPTRSSHPVRPKILFNVLFALLLGLFISIFLALFAEYLRKSKKKDYPQNITQ